MSNILEFADNLVLHLQRDRRSYKVITTGDANKFKVVNGLWEGDSVIDTKYLNMREVKQLFVDSCINGYDVKANIMFKEGLIGVARELAKEREEKEPPLVEKIGII